MSLLKIQTFISFVPFLFYLGVQYKAFSYLIGVIFTRILSRGLQRCKEKTNNLLFQDFNIFKVLFLLFGCLEKTVKTCSEFRIGDQIAVPDLGFDGSPYSLFLFLNSIFEGDSLTVKKLTAEPGFMGVAPGSGVRTWPPVSVCQKVSTMEHRSSPISR